MVPGDNDTIAHAQLTIGHGMIMVGSVQDDEFGQLIRPPWALGGVGSQCVYIVVEDTDKHHAKAFAAGAEIVQDIKDEGHGGRGYACRDPEGHLWYFGSYDPWGDGRYVTSPRNRAQPEARKAATDFT